jgi:dihydroorotase
MYRNDIPLLVHGEVTDPEVDMFDREAVFIDRVLVSRGRSGMCEQVWFARKFDV